MLSIQINTMAMLLSEFDFLPIYRADLAGSRTLSFGKNEVKFLIHGPFESESLSDSFFFHRIIKDNALITYLKFFIKIIWQLWLPCQPFTENFK